MPRGWIKDPERLAIAGIPDQVGFATKPALATDMLARALDARVPAAWVTGDEVYGTDPGLLAELEGRASAMYWRWPATTVSWLPVLLVTSAIGCAGRSGDADTKPASAPATTNDKPTDHEDHDLRLEY